MLAHYRTIQVIAFLLVMVGGMTALLGGRGAWQSVGSALESASWRRMLNGELMQTIDKAIAREVPNSSRFDGWAAGLAYYGLRDAGLEVRAGCPGWLFLAEEIREVSGGDRNLEQRVLLTRRIAAEFAQRGIILVSLSVPDKVDQVNDQLCGLTVALQAKQRVQNWRTALAGSSLFRIDIAGGWPKPGYWRTDTHWDRAGARFAAEKAADVLKRRIGPSNLRVRLETATAAYPRIGDLMRLAKLDRTADIFGPQPDSEVEETSVIERGGGLLDETPPPDVILAGSSYSLNSGFIDYLKFALSREVVQMSRPGGGFAGALLEILEKRPDVLQKIRVVVWEWPIRSLTQPLSEEEQRYLNEDKR